MEWYQLAAQLNDGFICAFLAPKELPFYAYRSHFSGTKSANEESETSVVGAGNTSSLLRSSGDESQRGIPQPTPARSTDPRFKLLEINPAGTRRNISLPLIKTRSFSLSFLFFSFLFFLSFFLPFFHSSIRPFIHSSIHSLEWSLKSKHVQLRHRVTPSIALYNS